MRWRSSTRAARLSLLLAALALLWANLPYLLGMLVSDQSHHFAGFFIFEPDGFSYLAKMRQGAAGAWLFTLPYDNTGQPGALVYPFYLLLGKLWAPSGLPPVVGYHIARLAASLALLAVAYDLLRAHTDPGRWRLASWCLLLFGGGFGWLLAAANPDYVAYASVAPDAFIYSVLFGPPHISAGLALLLWLWGRTAPAVNQADRLHMPSVLRWGLAELILILIRPSYGVMLPILLGAVLLGRWLAERSLPRAGLATATLIGLPALPYALYLLWVFQANPAMAGWAAQNPFGTPPPGNVLADLGPLLLLALLGIWSGRWWRSPARRIWLCWLAVLPLMLYAPLGFQRRLVGGAHLLLALPAGAWLANLHTGATRRPWRQLALLAGGLLLASYPLIFGLGATGMVGQRPTTLFLSSDERAAHDWLATRDDRPLVMAAEQTGIRLPAYGNAVPVLGHPIETLDATIKRGDVARFFGGSQDERATLLARYQVDLIWLGPAEQLLATGDAPFSPPAGWQPAFSHGTVTLWARPGF